MTDARIGIAIDATQAEAGGRRVSRSLDDVKRKATETTAANQNLNRGNREVAGSFNRMSQASGESARALQSQVAQVGLLSRAFSALRSPLTIVVSTITALTVGLRSAIREAEQFERIGLRTEAVVRATGGAAGFAAGEIRELAAEIGRTTLASEQQVENAAQRLMMFGSVAGDQFGRTLRLAQDLSSLGFGSIENAVLQLGRALEDPAEGLTALRRAGIIFSQAQRDVIKDMVETGRVAEAQEMVLGELEGRIGGAGAAEAGGLAGAVDQLGQNWREFLRNVGDSGPLAVATKGTNLLADAVRGLTEALFFDDLPMTRQLELLNREIDKLEQGARVSDIQQRFNDLLGIEAGDVGRLNVLLERRVELMRQIAQIESDRIHEQNLAAVQREREVQAERDIEAQRRAAAEQKKRELQLEQQRVRERQAALRQIETLEQQAALSGLEGIDLVEARRQQAHDEWQALLRRGIINLEEFARADVALTKQAEDEKQSIREKAEEERRRNQERIEEELRRARQRKEEEAAREFERIWDQGARNMQDTLAGAFDDALAGSIRSFRDFGSSVLAIMRRVAAQIAAMMVFRPVMGGLGGASFAGAGSVGGLPSFGGISSGLNQFGSNFGFSSGVQVIPGGGVGAGADPVAVLGSGGGLFGATTFSQFAGAAGLGALGGGVLSGVTGGNQMGGSLGGALGAGLGFAVGGPIGGIIGGLGGSVLGGLFGNRRRSVGPIGHTNIGVQDGRLFVGSTGADNRADPRATIAMANEAVASLNAIIDQFGLQVTGMGGLRGIGQGNPTALGSNIALSAGEFVQRFLQGGGLAMAGGQRPEAFQEALATGDVQALAQFFGRREQLEAAFAAMAQGAATLGQSVEQAAAAIKNDLRAQIQALRDEAMRFGLDAGDIEGSMRAAFNEETRRALLGITDPIALALEDLEREFNQRRAIAQELGANIVELERLHSMRRQRILDQGLNTMAGSLRDFLDNLMLDPRTSPLAPQDRLAEARGLFARAVDEQNIAEAQRQAQQLLNLSRDVFASSPMFFQDLQAVREALEALGKELQLPGFALGTSSAPRGLAIVGERGPEIVNFRGGESVSPNQDIMAGFDRMVRAQFEVGEGIVQTTRSGLDRIEKRLEKHDARFRMIERRLERAA